MAILEAMAISACANDLLRSPVSEGYASADGSKAAIVEFDANYGRFTGSRPVAGFNSITAIVISVDATESPGMILSTLAI